MPYMTNADRSYADKIVTHFTNKLSFKTSKHEKLVYKNIKFVIEIVSKLYSSASSKIEYSDILNVGLQGCWVAALKYNPKDSRGAKFTTYSVHWIRQYIFKYLQNNFYSVRVPQHMFIICGHVFKLTRKGLSEQEIKKILDIDDETYQLCINSNKQHTSLFTKISGFEESGEGSLLIDSIKSEDEIDEKYLLRKKLISILDNLNERDKGIVLLYFGFRNPEYSYGYADIGKLYGLSRERVRQIISNACKKLKHTINKLDFIDLLQ